MENPFDEALEEIFSALMQKREETLMVEVADPSLFKVALLGGAWTSRHRGVACDAFQGSARGEAAKAWCGQYHLNKSSRYEISMYGERAASLLAKSWCHKMEHFYNIF